WRSVMRGIVALLGMGVSACFVACEVADTASETAHTGASAQELSLVPTPPWPAGDERGMGNTQGFGTRLRCLPYLIHPFAKPYELAHERSPTMPSNPFSPPLQYDYRPTASAPFSRHAFNGEDICGEISGQGTQFDALGHFAEMQQVWDPEAGDPPVANASYYGGFTQEDVKPTPDSPLLRLGVEKAPPILTSAVLLDARSYLGGGQRLQAGQLITKANIKSMLAAQGLGSRGLLPGDALYIYAGWEDFWEDPDTTGEYYSKGPGLSVDAIEYLETKAIVLVGLDVPFIDAVTDGQLQGTAPPPPDRPQGLPFYVHHYALSKAGIHLIENAHLEEMAEDSVWLSCTIVLPLLERGGSGSAVRPVAYGTSLD